MRDYPDELDFIKVLHKYYEDSIGSVWSLGGIYIGCGMAVIMTAIAQISRQLVKLIITFTQPWNEIQKYVGTIKQQIINKFEWKGFLGFFGYENGSCRLIFEAELPLLWKLKLAKNQGNFQLGPFNVEDIALMYLFILSLLKFCRTVSNVKKVLPDLVDSLERPTMKLLIDYMNIDQSNNWYRFAIERWPDNSSNWFAMVLTKKMESVLELMIAENDSTDTLIHILKKLSRWDVINELHQIYPDDER